METVKWYSILFEGKGDAKTVVYFCRRTSNIILVLSDSCNRSTSDQNHALVHVRNQKHEIRQSVEAAVLAVEVRGDVAAILHQATTPMTHLRAGMVVE